LVDLVVDLVDLVDTWWTLGGHLVDTWWTFTGGHSLVDNSELLVRHLVDT
jgi:hypothetical protein